MIRRSITPVLLNAETPESTSLPASVSRSWIAVIIAAGFALRCMPAWHDFLNPDEAWHYLLAHAGSFRAAYHASLTTAHPPLYLLILHAWGSLGNSEFWLRTPSLLAGTGACWVTYLWLRLVASERAAVTGLLLLLFTPPMINLSSEVRQYGLLLLACAAALYFFELAVIHDSASRMAASAAALWIALLTHYSALLFAPALGIYSLLRIARRRLRPATLTAWITGQIMGVVISALLFITHVRGLRTSGLTQQIAETWLKSSVFHPGRDHVLHFLGGNTVRLFRFTFSHGTIGVIALLVFFAAIVSLMRRCLPAGPPIAVLILLSFFLFLICGLAGLYPYGGTRHDVLLAWLAILAISLGIASVKLDWRLQFGTLMIVLLICNLFPSPPPPFIRFHNQDRRWMADSIRTVQKQVSPGATLLTDYEGGLLLSYYLCGNTAVDLSALRQGFALRPCGSYQLLAPHQDFFVFDTSNYRQALAQAKEAVATSPAGLWLFQAGWIDSGTAGLRAKLPSFGCSEPQFFGENIYLCRLQPSP